MDHREYPWLVVLALWLCLNAGVGIWKWWQFRQPSKLATTSDASEEVHDLSVYSDRKEESRVNCFDAVRD